MGSLQVRLLLTYLVIIGVTLGLTALGLFIVLGGYRDSISYGNLEDVGALINDQAKNNLKAATAPGEPKLTNADLLVLLRTFVNQPAQAAGEPLTKSVAFVDADGVILEAASEPATRLKSAKVKDLTFPAAGSADRTPQRCRVDLVSGPDLLCVSMPLSEAVIEAFPDSNAAAIIVAEPAAGLGEVLKDLLPRLVFSGLMGLAAALALGFVLSQSVASPLRRIARAARSVARGNYRQRVPVTGPREVREVAVNFNRMTEEVQRSQETLRDFLMNISHELKTPLTSIRGFSEAMLDGTIDDSAGIERSAKIINNESTRVLRLVEELLDLSRIESGQVSMRQEDVNVAELFTHIEEVFALRAEESGVALQVDAPATAHVRGDFDRLEQVLNNLLDNAFRHTPRGGHIRLGARPVQQGLIQLTLSDTGKGIPPDDIPHLFERFYRATNGRNTKGYGLGLAITREIVRAHGGDIWANSDPGHGTSFVFTLPAVAVAVPRKGSRRRPRPTAAASA